MKFVGKSKIPTSHVLSVQHTKSFPSPVVQLSVIKIMYRQGWLWSMGSSLTTAVLLTVRTHKNFAIYAYKTVWFNTVGKIWNISQNDRGISLYSSTSVHTCNILIRLVSDLWFDLWLDLWFDIWIHQWLYSWYDLRYDLACDLSYDYKIIWPMNETCEFFVASNWACGYVQGLTYDLFVTDTI